MDNIIDAVAQFRAQRDELAKSLRAHINEHEASAAKHVAEIAKARTVLTDITGTSGGEGNATPAYVFTARRGIPASVQAAAVIVIAITAMALAGVFGS